MFVQLPVSQARKSAATWLDWQLYVCPTVNAFGPPVTEVTLHVTGDAGGVDAEEHASPRNTARGSALAFIGWVRTRTSDSHETTG